jgi:hypothetical protein
MKRSDPLQSAKVCSPTNYAAEGCVKKLCPDTPRLAMLALPRGQGNLLFVQRLFEVAPLLVTARHPCFEVITLARYLLGLVGQVQLPPKTDA